MPLGILSKLICVEAGPIADVQINATKYFFCKTVKG